MLTTKEILRVIAMERTYPTDPNPCFGAAPDPVEAARYRTALERLKFGLRREAKKARKKQPAPTGDAKPAR